MDVEVDAYQSALVVNQTEILWLLQGLAVAGSSLLLEASLHAVAPVAQRLALEVLQEMEVQVVRSL